MIGDSVLGIVAKISAKKDTKEIKEFREEVEKELKAIKDNGENSFNDVAGSIGLTAKQTASLSAALPIAGAAIATVATAAAGLGLTLFTLAKQTADFGTEISRFSTLTGFSVETIQGLKVAADNAGLSIDQIEEVFESFSEMVLEAGKGSEDAKDKLISLGLDPQTAFQDLEGSFLKILDKIRDMPAQAGKAKVAMDGFGESGLSFVKVAEEMEGGTEKYIERLKQLGVVMDADGVKKSKEFDKSLQELELQTKSLAYTFAAEYMPEITSGLQSVSSFLAENKDEFKSWGEQTTNYLRGVIEVIKDLGDAMLDLPDLEVDGEKRSWLTVLLGGAGGEWLYQKGRMARKKDTEEIKLLPAPRIQAEDSDILRDREKERAEAEKRAKEREDITKRDNAAQIQSLKEHLANEQRIYQDSFNKLKEQFKQDKNAESFEAGVQNIIEIYGNALTEILPKLEQLEKANGAFLKKTASELQLLAEQQAKRSQDLNNTTFKIVDEKQQLITENQRKEAEKRTKNTQTEIKNEIELREKASEKTVSMLESNLAQKLITNEQFIRAQQGLIAVFKETDKKIDYKDNKSSVFNVPSEKKNYEIISGQLAFRKQKLEEELKAVKGNAEEETRINQELAKLKIEIEQEYYRQKKQNAEENIKTLENERDIQIELLELRLNILRAEREIVDFRKAQERKSLENLISGSDGQKRVDAIENLKQFDLAEAQRRADNRQFDLESSLEIALKRVEGTENEEAKKAEIIESYRQKALLNEEEFQAALQEIRDSYRRAENEARDNADPFNRFTAGIGSFLENIALVRDNLGQLQFSFETVFNSIADIGLQAFSSLAQGFGQMVAGWVLGSDKGSSSLRKLAANVLAQVASMATTYALMSLAAAALATTVWGAAILGGTPSQFLQAAALFGAVAVGAAVGGRLIAGDSFKQENSGAFGSAQGGSRSGNGSPQAYSGQGGKITEYGGAINAPMQYNRFDLRFGGESYIFDIIENDVSNGGRLHELFRHISGD